MNKKEKPSFLDLTVFGLKLKPWHGIVVGVIIQMLFGSILGALGGILIIASVITLIRDFIKRRK